VYEESFETSIHGKRVLLHHGDGLAVKDLGYRLIRPVLRSRFNRSLYRWLHPDIGVRLARGSSRSSRAYTSQKDYGESSGMEEFARRRIEQGVDYVLMGHLHQPEYMRVGEGAYVNLGDWIAHSTYAVLEGGRLSLKTWVPEGAHGR
jgi:UDP-2,3-diacylglucosamine hydrolase